MYLPPGGTKREEMAEVNEVRDISGFLDEKKIIKDANDIRCKKDEAGVIATLIHHPDFYSYSENLLPDYFIEEHNSQLYRAITSLAQKGATQIDRFALDGCEDTKLIPVTTLERIIEESKFAKRDTVEDYKIYVDNVIDAAFKRATYKALETCIGFFHSDTTIDLRKAIYEEIDKVMTGFSSLEDDIPEFKDVVDELWEEVEQHQDGKEAGIPFKFPTLNSYVRLEPGELVVVGAPAKGAKSMFMLNEAVDMLKKGKSVMYLDSELSSRLFLCRLISHMTKIEFSRVRSGRYSDAETEKISQAINEIKGWKLTHLYMPIFNEKAIYAAVKRVSHKYDKLDVIIVDYLKPTGNSTEAYTVYSELGNLTDLIKNEICGKMDIAGLAAAQLNTNNKLADSAKIARNASTIMVLVDKTPEELVEDGEDSGRKKLVVVQNRNGMQHIDGEWINIDFNGNICSLEEAKVPHVIKEPY